MIKIQQNYKIAQIKKKKKQARKQMSIQNGLQMN